MAIDKRGGQAYLSITSPRNYPKAETENKEMTTKADVRKDFFYARQMMTLADKMMKDKTITDFSESSEIGQVALELIASASTFLQWLNEQENK